MFGYVTPVRCALSEEERAQFKGAYCGLCHRLRARYGLVARFVLNYDFTFLAILLSQGEEEISREKKRCVVSPIRRRCCILGSEAFSQAAGYSLILTWWKLQDAISDNGPIAGLSYRGTALLLRRAYRRAAADFPEFDSHCRVQIEKLRKLEQAGCTTLDQVADAFAAILPFAAVGFTEDQEKRRIFEQLLYQTGRWIYLIDAYDDLEKDSKTGDYNPLLARLSPPEGKLGEADKAWLLTTLTHSANLIASAFNLLPRGQWSGILENIIYLGFPAVTERVLEGRFRRGKKRKG